ncbi:MAG TPA: LysR substrate-binding domain-containing protein [Gemmatimonadaceae bacterium]|nr:LysR substrate-binding domain-containing protein [Gemmatimonadaceae bacterium]
MSINLHHLRLFTSVVDRGGFTKAAAALHLSQPAISKSINELEKQLHLSLLDRSSRTVKLTDAGETLYAHAKQLFGVERAAEQDLRELRGMKRGVLRVAASTTIATYMLPGALGRFHLRHPGVQISVASANTRQVLKMLLQWHVDVALVEGPATHPRVHAHPWRDDELVVIAPPDHRLVAGADVTDLAHETFLVREPGSGTRVVTENALERSGVRLSRTMRVGGTEAMKQGVAAGLGLAIVSRAAAADQLQLGKVVVVPVRGFKIVRQLTRLTLEGRSPTAPARELSQLLEEDAGTVAADASGDGGASR